MNAIIHTANGPLRSLLQELLVARGHETRLIDRAVTIEDLNGVRPGLVFLDVASFAFDSKELVRAARSMANEFGIVLIGLAPNSQLAYVAAVSDFHDVILFDEPPERISARIVFAEQRHQRHESRRESASEAKADRALLDAFFRNGSDSVYAKDLRHRFIRVNAFAGQFLGFDNAEELLGKTDHDLFPAEQANAYRATEARLFATGEPIVNLLEGPIGPPDRQIWVISNKAPVRDENGRIIGLVGVGRDVTSTVNDRRDLKERDLLFQSLIEQIPAITYAHDYDTVSGVDTMVYVSPTVRSILGFSQEEFARQVAGTRFSLIHPDDIGYVASLADVSYATGQPFTAEYRMRSADGSWKWFHNESRLVPDPDTHPEGIQRWQGLLVDLTERRHMEERLVHQAFHDPLTGLPNRASFTTHLEHALLAAGRSFATVTVLFLDLDDFKYVNDTLGHEAGDQLLVSVAERLRGLISPSDIVARLGGDEFTVLLGDSTRDAGDGIAFARRIADAIALPFEIGGRSVYITASIGIAHGEGGEARPLELLRDADVAMYQAKRIGKGTIRVFDPSLSALVEARLVMEQELRRAVDQSEFVVAYQPIISVQTGMPVMMEALIRWNHPRWGVVAPADFVPLAEEVGLILPIGKWVLEQACRQAELWRRNVPLQPPAIVSVNLSPRQFEHADLLKDIKTALDETGLPPEQLQLEITEGVLVADSAHAIQILQQLRALGVRLALDDFGTGYSSLSQLKQLPVDVVKVDRSFIHGLGSDSKTWMIVQAIVSMCRMMEIDVAAEGVETPLQRTQLRRLHFALAQGHLYAEPMRAEEATRFLAAAGGAADSDQDSFRAWAYSSSHPRLSD
jgi:diguanylate cyclase (GGDEF)-like protein/PAS domain S-box-containing protein